MAPTDPIEPPAQGDGWTVAAIHRYPVKSMAGETVAAATLGVRGVTGDRRWAVVDAASGVALSAKRHAALLHCRARIIGSEREDPPTVEVQLPDGAVVGHDDPDRAAALLTALLSRRVRLDAAGRARVHNEFPDDAAPAERRARKVVAGLRGMYADGAPVHLLTGGMLAAAAAGDTSRAAVARYRPNIVLTREEGPDDTDESRWHGRRLRVGDALVEVTAGCVRCTMIGMSQPGVEQDRGLLRDVVARRDAVVGLYAKVLTPGDTAIGDAARVVGGQAHAAAASGAVDHDRGDAP